MAVTKATCDYVLNPGDPQTGGGEEVDRCYVAERWECPHDAHATIIEGDSERALCLFHLPPDRKDDDAVVDAFIEAVSDASQSEDSDVSRRKQQFIGARFNHFDVGDTEIPVDEENQLDFRHARFTNGVTFELTFEYLNEPDETYHGAVSLSESTVGTNVDLRGATFDGDVLFWDLNVRGNVDLNGTVVDGDVVLSKSAIEGNLDLSGTVTDGIYIDVATVGGWVKLDGLKTEYIGLQRTRVGDDVYVRAPDSLPHGARFDNAKVSGGILISGKIAAETIIKDDMVFANAIVRDGFVVREVTIEGEIDFEDGLVEGPVDLHETTVHDGGTFRDLNFAEANLRDATIPRADFQRTDLTAADLSGADLRGSNLEQAILSRANLFDTDLRGAGLYGAVMGDAQINHDTRFGEYCVYDTVGTIKGPTAINEDDVGASVLAKAAAQYRTLEQLARTNAFPDRVGDYFIRRKDVYRRQHQEEDRHGRRLLATISRSLWLYGESWRRLMMTAAVVIVLFGGLYAATGGIHVTTRPPTHALDLPQLFSVSVSQPVGTLLLSVYFSVVTFTTLGYGDIQPTNPATQTLAGIESLIGAILIAMLVFVFARRATR